MEALSAQTVVDDASLQFGWDDDDDSDDDDKDDDSDDGDWDDE